MKINDEYITQNPIYKEETIRHKARLDEEERRAKISAEAKRKKDFRKRLIYGVASLIMVLIIYFKLIKAFGN
ncbi:hypothetical protein [Xylanivirga thermophila]|jgi:hypothetical protein|uniref:hypothetical protein n=1 Tax=Xylanivirga thermophila TaxID=2496273 RepID=UPI00101BD9C2|nr:hypothetical protein [Xylanivirga thermophila]